MPFELVDSRAAGALLVAEGLVAGNTVAQVDTVDLQLAVWGLVAGNTVDLRLVAWGLVAGSIAALEGMVLAAREQTAGNTAALLGMAVAQLAAAGNTVAQDYNTDPDSGFDSPASAFPPRHRSVFVILFLCFLFLLQPADPVANLDK